MKSKNVKRILSVVVKHVLDYDADTSYLGTYDSKAKTDFAIDRRHTQDCASVKPNADEAQRLLSQARGTVAEYQALEPNSDTLEWEALEEAYNLLDQLADEVTECDCGGVPIDRNSYEYFNSASVDSYNTPEENIKYAWQDYDRMESLNNQNWYYLGIVAEAKVSAGNHVQTFTASCWGIESDSDKSFFTETENDILAELKDQLAAWGFSKRAISTAFKTIERREE